MVVGADRSKDKFFFFYDSLLDIAQAKDEQLWAFAAYFGRGLKVVSLSASNFIYATPDLALRAAKLHALKMHVYRSRQLQWLTDYPSDRVITQSEEVIGLFGKTRDFLVMDLYQKKQARADFLRKVTLEEMASLPVKMFDLDGRLLDGVLTSQLVKLDADTAVLLEEFELRNVTP